jgi:hypothetical protein
MIEHEVVSHEVDKKVVMRFVFDGDDDYEPEVHWCCSSGGPPKRRWYIGEDGDHFKMHSFKDASWARRFSKIVDKFRAYVDDPEWRVEILEATEEKTHTVTLERLWPLNAIEMLAKVGQDA